MSTREGDIELGMKLTTAIEAIGLRPDEFVVSSGVRTRNFSGMTSYDIQAIGAAGKSVSIRLSVEEFA